MSHKVRKYGDPVRLHTEYLKLLPQLVELQNKLDECEFEACIEGDAELSVSASVDYLVQNIVRLLIVYSYDGGTR